jgi:hypothetical protein
MKEKKTDASMSNPSDLASGLNADEQAALPNMPREDLAHVISFVEQGMPVGAILSFQDLPVDKISYMDGTLILETFSQAKIGKEDPN